MKLQTNLPQNADFFERYAALITSLTGVATIAQFITGVCEIGILYGLIYPSLVDIAPLSMWDFARCYWRLFAPLCCKLA